MILALLSESALVVVAYLKMMTAWHLARFMLLWPAMLAISFVWMTERWQVMFLPAPPVTALVSNDNEPITDFDRVRDELYLIASLMEDGRHKEAADELDRLCMLMDGHDEAALVDERYAREQQRRRG